MHIVSDLGYDSPFMTNICFESDHWRGNMADKGSREDFNASRRVKRGEKKHLNVLLERETAWYNSKAGWHYREVYAAYQNILLYLKKLTHKNKGQKE